MLLYILLFTFLASISSLFLVAILLLHKNLIHKISFSLISFAAGALLATGFLDTLKEAVEKGGESVFLWTTISIAGFFLIERLFLFLHHHDEKVRPDEEDIRLPAPLLLFGEALHNFIDGASIAVTFLASFPLGIITTIAVFVHEIPHELGDFGILIHKGWNRWDVLKFNLAAGVGAIVGAVLAFYLGNQFKSLIPVLLSITTGNFIYLSATDLLPELHHKAKGSLALGHALFFLAGIVLITVLIKILG